MCVHASLNSNHPFFSNFSNLAIGHDKLFNEMVRIVDNVPYPSAGSYPPHNLIKDGDGHYTIELATAGFNKEELEVKTESDKLTISGKKLKEEDDKKIVHKGIARRPFSKSFILAEDVVVNDASFSDGMLTINLQKVIPEEKKEKIYSL